MSSSLNCVMLIGNVGRDPEIKTVQSGGRYATLSIATSESWKDKSTGERKERTEWHRVVVWVDVLVGVIEKYVKKGSKIYIQGQLETRKWTDQSGQDRYSTEVVLRQFNSNLQLLDGRNSSGGEQPSTPVSQVPNGPKNQQYGGHSIDDEIPF